MDLYDIPDILEISSSLMLDEDHFLHDNLHMVECTRGYLYGRKRTAELHVCLPLQLTALSDHHDRRRNPGWKWIRHRSRWLAGEPGDRIYRGRMFVRHDVDQHCAATGHGAGRRDPV